MPLNHPTTLPALRRALHRGAQFRVVAHPAPGHVGAVHRIHSTHPNHFVTVAEHPDGSTRTHTTQWPRWDEVAFTPAGWSVRRQWDGALFAWEYAAR